MTLRGALWRLRRRRTNRRAVQEFSRSLALIVDRDALVASVAARIKELFDPDRLLILLPAPPAGDFVPSFVSGIDGEAFEGGAPLRLSKLARWLLVNESSLNLVRQRGVHDYLGPAEKELLGRLRLTLCVPLISLNRLTGILMLGSDQPEWELGTAETELLELLASQASLAFENAALYREQQERLEQLHQTERLAAVGQLAAAVAHEIRNPLTAIRSTMQYLLQSFESGDPKEELAGELLAEVDRINRTISGLLSLSRPAKFEPVEVHIRDTLDQTVKLMSAHASKLGVALERHPVERDFWVLGDPGELKQVFLNLLLNALQAMPEGGRICLDLEPWQGDGGPDEEGWVEVTIADDGPGIPPERLRKVLDPFFTTKREGTGLGLAICHGIVERHSGVMRLESQPGQGTRVLVRLPLLR